MIAVVDYPGFVILREYSVIFKVLSLIEIPLMEKLYTNKREKEENQNLTDDFPVVKKTHKNKRYKCKDQKVPA
jgi:hypothetical protein